MNYKVLDDKIVVYDKNCFNAKHILECGQIFRFKQLANDDYVVFSGDKKAQILEKQNCYEIVCSDVLYFENFFDLNTDYQTIKGELSQKFSILNEACQYGHGIRILKQQPFETIISFIISANNNIKRIQGIIERLCTRCGTNMGDYYAFPTQSQLETLTVGDLRALGMGFRAEYVFNTTKLLKGVNLQKLSKFSTSKLLEFLISLSGVGPKVADCIALFAYHKMDCFPVDTWIKKVYNQYFLDVNESIVAKGTNILQKDNVCEQTKNCAKCENISGTNKTETAFLNDENQTTKRVEDVKIIRKNLTELFGNLSGYAQQYLFYYKREMDRRGI
ncbi:MAG TPA: hypothetical protein DCZ34_01525 [Clostridiales bacterium]|nr:hypothetical protein [Clostridiales bacterium]